MDTARPDLAADNNCRASGQQGHKEGTGRSSNLNEWKFGKTSMAVLCCCVSMPPCPMGCRYGMVCRVSDTHNASPSIGAECIRVRRPWKVKSIVYHRVHTSGVGAQYYLHTGSNMFFQLFPVRCRHASSSRTACTCVPTLFLGDSCTLSGSSHN
jgi:hypothetical protein